MLGLVVLLYASAAIAGPRVGVLAEERVGNVSGSAMALTQALQHALISLGYESSAAQTVALYRRGLRAGHLLASTPPKTLSVVRGVDLAIAARLAMTTQKVASGVSFQARLDLKVLEISASRRLASFSASMTGREKTSGAARGTARRTLLRRAWKTLKPILQPIAGGQGEVLLFLRGLPFSPIRLAARLADFPELADARLLSVDGGQALLSLRASKTSTAKALPALLRERLGIVFAARRPLAWWGRWRGIPHALNVRCVAAASARGIAGHTQRLARSLLTHLLASTSLRLRPREDATGLLRISWQGGHLRAQAKGLGVVSVPLADPSALAVAVWKLAVALDAAAGRARPALAALPAMTRLRGGVAIAKLDLLGVLAGTGTLQGLRGPATIAFSKAVKAKVSVPGYAKAVTIVGKSLAPVLRINRATLAAFPAPRAAALRLDLTVGEGASARRDLLEVPLPLWSRQVKDGEEPRSLAGLVDVADVRVRQRLGAALDAARGAPSLLRLERGMWLPLCAYGALFASRPRVLGDRPGGRLSWLRLPGETLEKNAGTRRDLTLAFVSLVQAGGARARLFPQKKGILVAVDTGWLPSAAGLARVLRGRFVSLDGTLWVPLWIDGKGKFLRANTAGVKRFRALGRRLRRGGIEIVSGAVSLPASRGLGGLGAVVEAAARKLLAAQKSQAAAIIARAHLDRGSIKKRLAVAQKLLQIRAVAKARQLLEGYLVMHEGDPRAELFLAVSYAYQGALALARRHFIRARGANAHLGAGIMSLILGDQRRAAKELRAAGASGRRARARLASSVVKSKAGSTSKGGVPGTSGQRWVGGDPQAEAFGRISGASNLRQREALLGHRAGPDRRLIRWATDLLRY
ncbi:MAG: hypothetical protein KAI47_11710 [Deltaproteobacteria bacterium]|nr:hypothetical protein [Deltaproteobacteria bacterium]